MATAVIAGDLSSSLSFFLSAQIVQAFENILSLRSVHDSNGVYRFCICVNADAEAPSSAFELHAALVQLLPRKIKIPRDTPPCGPYHEERVFVQPGAFHRTLFLFTCRSSACHARKPPVRLRFVYFRIITPQGNCPH